VLKFIYLEKLKIIIALIVFIKYSLWCLFLILQGNAINIALKQHSLQKELIFTLAGYILTKIIVMLCDVFTKFITDYYRNLELQQQWQASFPRYVYNDTKNDQ
jgi:hypothetical protein